MAADTKGPSQESGSFPHRFLRTAAVAAGLAGLPSPPLPSGTRTERARERPLSLSSGGSGPALSPQARAAVRMALHLGQAPRPVERLSERTAGSTGTAQRQAEELHPFRYLPRARRSHASQNGGRPARDRAAPHAFPPFSGGALVADKAGTHQLPLVGSFL